MTLHLSKCKERVLLCKIPGCKNICRRKNFAEQMEKAYESHTVGQAGEIQRLRTIIYEKVCLTPLRSYHKESREI